jgi:deoxyribodipyrimidine photolyase-related protein
MRNRLPKRVRRLVLVLVDQLDMHSAALDGFDADADVVWMAEVKEKSAHVWSHKARIVLFLSAMRHFRDSLIAAGHVVDYHLLDVKNKRCSFTQELRSAVKRLKPERLIVVEPGEWRVQQIFRRTAQELGAELEIRPDRSFLCSREEFAEYAGSRKRLLMEHFYREQRRKHGILMKHGKPRGNKWNFDKENRGTFGKSGPGEVARPVSFPPDKVTQEVIALVQKHFPEHPGKLHRFDWAVTPEEAEGALNDFIKYRLGNFGRYQDALWIGHPFLYHSRLSSAMNLKILDPRKVIRAAERALERRRAPLNSVEGFIRQIAGWREYVRGVYWRHMPGYIESNEFDAHLPLPEFYWTGETDMNCMHECIVQTLEYGYAHHIQRLMVTGLFALLLGVEPKQVHEWYLAIYVDAVEWVELPNTIGMSQYADGGLMATKPYVATGAYIDRMSNYCSGCRFDPRRRTGEEACPFTTLYWDFLLRHERILAKNRRMSLQLRNLGRLDKHERQTLRRRAELLKKTFASATGEK